VETSPKGAMKEIDKLANKMSDKMHSKLEAKGFVISTIVVVSAVISIIYNLVKLSKLCKYEAKEALEHIKKPNLLDKIKIRKAIRSSLKENKVKVPRGVAGDSFITIVESAVSEAVSTIDENDIKIILDATEE
jgi:hypothetical protein